MRKPTDKCLLCTINFATQTNSHIIPAALLKASIGKRYYEESYKIDASKGVIDSYFGRNRLDNPTTEIKQSHVTRDYYFCPECESKLGVLEGEVTPHLDRLRDEKYSQNYESKVTIGGLKYLTFKKLDSEKFHVFFLSVIWRISLLNLLEGWGNLLNSIDLELHRRIIWYYLYKYTLNYSANNDKFGMVILTSEQFSNPTKNVNIAFDFINRPKIFWIYEYVVLHYSAEDFVKAKTIGANYWRIPPDLTLLNYPPERPVIAFVSDKSWREIFLGVVYNYSAKEYIHSLALSLSQAKGFIYDLSKRLILERAIEIYMETRVSFADCCTIAERELRELSIINFL